MPVCSSNAADHEVTTAIIPSPDSRAATSCASLVHVNEATVPQRTQRVHDREARAKVLSKANPLRSNIAGKAPHVLRFPVRQALSSRLLAQLELKHYSVLIPSAGIKGTRHSPMRYPKELLHQIV